MSILLANSHLLAAINAWVWIVIILSILAVFTVFFVNFLRNYNNRRIEELEKTAGNLEAHFFRESEKTRFIDQLRCLEFPIFSPLLWRWHYPAVTFEAKNIFQKDIASGRIFQFDYLYIGGSTSGGGRIEGGVVLLHNRRARVSKPVVVSNCLVEYWFRQFWFSNHKRLRETIRLKLKERETCHVEISNDGILYFSRPCNAADDIAEKLSFVQDLFMAVETIT